MLGLLLDDHAVDDDVNRVHLVAIECYLLVKVSDLSVYADPHEPGLSRVLEYLVVLTLAVADDGGEHHQSPARRQFKHRVDNLLDGLALDRLPALRAMRPAGASVQKPKVVVDLGLGSDSRARIARGAFLVDGNGR